MFILIVIFISINCIKCQNVLNSIWSFPLRSNKSLLIVTSQVVANIYSVGTLCKGRKLLKQIVKNPPAKLARGNSLTVQFARLSNLTATVWSDTKYVYLFFQQQVSHILYPKLIGELVIDILRLPFLQLQSNMVNSTAVLIT